MSKYVDIKLVQVGHVIMLEEDDWKRIVQFLQDHDLSVKERRPTQRAPDWVYWRCEFCSRMNIYTNSQCGHCGKPPSG